MVRDHEMLTELALMDGQNDRQLDHDTCIIGTYSQFAGFAPCQIAFVSSSVGWYVLDGTENWLVNIRWWWCVPNRGCTWNRSQIGKPLNSTFQPNVSSWLILSDCAVIYTATANDVHSCRSNATSFYSQPEFPLSCFNEMPNYAYIPKLSTRSKGQSTKNSLSCRGCTACFINNREYL